MQYLSEAENVSAGRGLTTSILHFDVEYAHGQLPAPVTTFPPGYALAIATLHLAGIPTLWAGALLSALALIGLVPLLLSGCRALQLTANATRTVLLLTITSSQLLYYSSAVLTEALFAWLTLATIVLVIHSENVDEDRRRIQLVALAAVCAGLAYWVRYAGVFLVATLAGFYALRFLRRRKPMDAAAFVSSCIGVAAVAAGFLRNWLLSGTFRGGNTKAVSRSVARIVISLPKMVPRLVFGEANLGAHWLAAAKVAMLIAIVAAGWFVLSRATAEGSRSRSARPAAFLYAFLAVYAAGLTWLGVTTVITYDERMFVVLLPVGFFAAGQGLSAVEQALASPLLQEIRHGALAARGWRVAAAGGLAFYLTANGASTFAMATGPLPDVLRALSAPTASGQSLRDWIEDNCPKDGVIAAVDGQATGFELRRPTLSLIESQFSAQTWTEAHLKTVLLRFGAKYLIVYPSDTSVRKAVQSESPFLQRLVARQTPDWLVPVADNPMAAVYRVVGAERRADLSTTLGPR